MAAPAWTDAVNHQRYNLHEGTQHEDRAALRGLYGDREWYFCNDWESPVHASYPHVKHFVYPLSSHILEPLSYQNDDQPFLFSKLSMGPNNEPTFNSPKAQEQFIWGGVKNVTEPYIDTETGSILVDIEVLRGLVEEAMVHRLNVLRGEYSF